MSQGKDSIFNDEDYLRCDEDYKEWLETGWVYYKKTFCCKPTKNCVKDSVIKQAYSNVKEYIKEKYDKISSNNMTTLCCLPKNHKGKCTDKIHSCFTNKTLKAKCDWIYSTPGNNDYVYKNRSSRLFPIRISYFFEKKIKNKNRKLKCAIPLKDASTPEMLLSAYVDYLTIILHIHGILEFIDVKNKFYKEFNPILLKNKNNITEFFDRYDRTLFDSKGYSLCPVIGERFNVQDVISADITHPKSVQMSHVKPRSEIQYTIRGPNIVMMSREGNRILGDNDFIGDTWLDTLRSVLRFNERK